MCDTPAWKQMWPNVARLLSAPELKSVFVAHYYRLSKTIKKEEIFEYTSKLEFGILALLFCEHDKIDRKLDFLYFLANFHETSKSYEGVYGLSHEDRELKFIFGKLLQYAIDLPERYASKFEGKQQGGANLYLCDNADEVFKTVKEQLRDEEEEYAEEYQDEMLNDVVFKNDPRLIRKAFLKRFMTEKDKTGILFDPN